MVGSSTINPIAEANKHLQKSGHPKATKRSKTRHARERPDSRAQYASPDVQRTRAVKYYEKRKTKKVEADRWDEAGREKDEGMEREFDGVGWEDDEGSEDDEGLDDVASDDDGSVDDDEEPED